MKKSIKNTTSSSKKKTVTPINKTVKKTVVKSKVKKTEKKNYESIPDDTVLVYHKPNCSTSRNVMDLLKKKKVKTMVRLYIEDSPTSKELELLLAKLDMKPEELVRKKESYFQEKLKGLKLNDQEWIREMAENPVLIERPVLIYKNSAVVGRPMEKVEEFLKKVK